MPIGQKKIETGIDVFLDYLKGRGKVELSQVAKDLNTPVDIIQTWTDFLVEEEILGIDYKFTKPYIHLIDKKGREEWETDKDLLGYKKEFETQAKKKDVSPSKTAYLWKNHLEKEIDSKKEFFYQQAQIRNLKNIEELWNEYKSKNAMV